MPLLKQRLGPQEREGAERAEEGRRRRRRRDGAGRGIAVERRQSVLS
jgi:hypothetical protein